MFAKLKKKIQEEAQNVVGATETERWPAGKPASPAAPGLASPVSKDYPADEPQCSSPRGPIFGHNRKDSLDFSSKMGSRTSSVDDIAKDSSSKEEVLAMLMKRTDQVKKLETKISELATMLKEKNKKIEKLEVSLTKQEEAALEQLEEIKEKYYAEKAKVSMGFKEAVDKKEEELRSKVQKELHALEKENSQLEERLTKAEEYREKYFKTEEENDELQGLATQELAKVKHMFMITQDELKEKKQNILESDKKVLNLENEIKSLLKQITTLNSKCEEAEDTNRTLTNSLEEARKSADAFRDRLKEQQSEFEKQYFELQSAYASMKSEKQQLEQDRRAKSEEIEHLQERIQTLTQRLQEGDLSGDERVQALENERDTLETKLAALRTQLGELKMSSSGEITTLQQQVSELQQRVTESSGEAEKYRKELHDVQNNLQKEVESWKSKLHMALLEVKEKESLLETVKDSHETELIRQRKNSSAMEVDLRDQLRQLKLQLDSSERVREREKVAAQEKISKLENGQEDWLEREIDAERQITRLEEDLQKTKVEVSEKDKEILSFKKQLIIKKKEQEDLEAKIHTLEQTIQQNRHEVQNREGSLSSLQQELRNCTIERDDLLLRNAQLSQEFESHKRETTQRLADTEGEVTRRDAAVGGLEQSLLDLQQEAQQQREKLRHLEAQRTTALDKVESDEINRLKQELSDSEAQLIDKSKTIKMLQQRLTDLKKTLQRELKVQALPNDEPPDRLSASPASSSLTPSSSTRDLQTSPVPQETSNGLHSGAHVSKPKPTPTSPPVIPISQTAHQHFPPRKSYGGGSHRGPNTAYMRPYPPDVYREGLAMGKDTPSVVGGHANSHGHYSGNNRLEEMNFEYLKHVVLKFMLSHEHEAVHLIKAISVLLHFTPEEQRLIKDTLEWKMSWFGTKPQLGKGQHAKALPSPHY